MLAHFYIASVSAGYAEVEEMETLCESELFAPILFWSKRPDTVEKWTESLIKWVLALHNKALKISATRYQFPLIDIIAKHGYGVDKVTQGKLCSGGQPLWKALERQLDTDHQFPDMAAMWKSIRNTVSQELGKEDIREQEAVHYMIRKTRPFNEDSEKLLEAILKDWETAKLKSPFLLL
ncbi:hypothetical protein VE03_10589 [Pseudogymnoascus sp. 23342-1-I1]|nr:hypothetical protein VE03_10589 [Pseudogymnoascus sp. 23342-1-I1]